MKSIEELLEEYRTEQAELNKDKSVKDLLAERRKEEVDKVNQVPGANILGGRFTGEEETPTFTKNMEALGEVWDHTGDMLSRLSSLLPVSEERARQLDLPVPMHETPERQEKPLSQAENILMEHIGGMFGLGRTLEKEKELKQAQAKYGTEMRQKKMTTEPGAPVEQEPSQPSNIASQILAHILGTGVEYMPYVMGAAPAGGLASSAIGPASGSVPAGMRILREAVRGATTLGGAELIKNVVEGGMEPEDLEKAVLIGAIADPIISESVRFIAGALKGKKIELRGKLLQEGEVPVSLNKYDQGTMKKFITEISRGNIEGARSLLSEGDADLLINLYSNSPSFKKTVIEIAKGHKMPGKVNVRIEEFMRSSGRTAPAARAQGPVAGLYEKGGLRGAQAAGRTGVQRPKYGPMEGTPGERAHAGLKAPIQEGRPDILVGGTGMSAEQELALVQRSLTKFRRAVQTTRAKGHRPSNRILERIASLEATEEQLKQRVSQGKYPDEVMEKGQEKAKKPLTGMMPQPYKEPLPPAVYDKKARVQVPEKPGEPIAVGTDQKFLHSFEGDAGIGTGGATAEALSPEEMQRLRNLNDKAKGRELYKADQVDTTGPYVVFRETKMEELSAEESRELSELREKAGDRYGSIRNPITQEERRPYNRVQYPPYQGKEEIAVPEEVTAQADRVLSGLEAQLWELGYDPVATNRHDMTTEGEKIADAINSISAGLHRLNNSKLAISRGYKRADPARAEEDETRIRKFLDIVEKEGPENAPDWLTWDGTDQKPVPPKATEKPTKAGGVVYEIYKGDEVLESGPVVSGMGAKDLAAKEKALGADGWRIKKSFTLFDGLPGESIEKGPEISDKEYIVRAHAKGVQGLGGYTDMVFQTKAEAEQNKIGQEKHSDISFAQIIERPRGTYVNHPKKGQIRIVNQDDKYVYFEDGKKALKSATWLKGQQLGPAKEPAPKKEEEIEWEGKPKGYAREHPDYIGHPKGKTHSPIVRKDEKYVYFKDNSQELRNARWLKGRGDYSEEQGHPVVFMERSGTVWTAKDDIPNENGQYVYWVTIRQDKGPYGPTFDEPCYRLHTDTQQKAVYEGYKELLRQAGSSNYGFKPGEIKKIKNIVKELEAKLPQEPIVEKPVSQVKEFKDMSLPEMVKNWDAVTNGLRKDMVRMTLYNKINKSQDYGELQKIIDLAEMRDIGPVFPMKGVDHEELYKELRLQMDYLQRHGKGKSSIEPRRGVSPPEEGINVFPAGVRNAPSKSTGDLAKKSPTATPAIEEIRPKSKKTESIRKARRDLSMTGAMQGDIDGVSVKIISNETHPDRYGLEFVIDGVRMNPNWDAPINNNSLAEAPNRAVEVLEQLESGELSKEWLTSMNTGGPAPAPKKDVVSSAGTSVKVKTQSGQNVDTQYILLDADDLVVSHKLNFEPNPEYPKELQPRERNRGASQVQVERILSKLDPERLGPSLMATEGAPIVGPDLVVESGNGRTLAIQAMYDRHVTGAISKYSAWLKENAGSFGIGTGEIGKYKKPILVRKRTSDIDRVKFAQAANESPISTMSATEQAQLDAKRVTMDMLKTFNVNANGDILSGNSTFIQQFSELVSDNELGRFMAPDGKVSQEGIQRIRNALFFKAFGDPSALVRMSEMADDNTKNIINGLVQAAPRMAMLQSQIEQGQAYDISIAQETVRAVNVLSNLRTEGTKVIDYINQGSLFDDELSRLEKKILMFFDENKRSAKKIARLYDEFAYIVEGRGDPRTQKIFDTEEPTPEEVFEVARKMVSEGEKGGQGGLFEERAPAQRDKQALRGDQGKKGAGTEEIGPVAMKASGNPLRYMEPDRPVAAAGEKVAPIHIKEIKEKFNELFTPWREKRLGRGMKSVLGWYNPGTDIIRTRFNNDITVAMHELGHFLDFKLGLHDPINATMATELIRHGLDTSALGYSSEQIIMEGVAQFFQFYSVNPDQAKTEFPMYYENFMRALKANPEVKSDVDQFVELVRRWYKQDPLQRLKGSMVHSSKVSHPNLTMKDRANILWVDTWTDWMDDKYPLLQVDRTVSRIKNIDPKTLPDELSPYNTARASVGVPKDVERQIEGLESILKNIPEEEASDFQAFLSAQTAMDYWENGLEPGMGITKQEAQEIIDQAPQQYADLAEKIYDWYKGVMLKTLVPDMLPRVQLEYWSDRTIDPDTGKMRGKWPHYTPVFRDLNDEEAVAKVLRGRGKSFVNIPEPRNLKARKGAGDPAAVKPFFYPLEMMVKSVIQAYNLKARNDVGKVFLNIARLPKMGEVAEIVGGPASPADCVFSVWHGGERKFVATDPLIYRAVTEMAGDTAFNNMLWKGMQKISNLMRKSFTRYNPAFAAKNLIRDPFDVARNTDAKNKLLFQHHVVGLMKILSDDPIFIEAIEQGVLYSGISEELKDLTKGVNEMFHQGWKDEMQHDLNPMKWLQILGEFNSKGEIAPKIAEYMYLRQQGVSPKRAVVKAREVNIDFQCQGRQARKANQVIPFFSPALQGIRIMAKVLKDHPVRTLSRLWLLVVVPTVALWWKYKDDPEYQEMSRRKRDNYWNFKVGDKWYRIPGPFETKILFGAVIERALDYAYGKDPEAFRGFGKALRESLLPEVIPGAIQPWWEVAQNWIGYMERPIVPKSMEGMPKELQYGPYTSDTAKALSKVIPLSPYEIDHVYRGYTGQLGQAVLSTAEAITKWVKGDEDNAPKRYAHELPFINSFTSTPYRGSESVDRFYDHLKELEEGHNGAKAQGKVYQYEGLHRQFQKTRQTLSLLWKSNNAIREHPNMSSEQKRERMDKFYLQAVKIARAQLDSYYKHMKRK